MWCRCQRKSHRTPARTTTGGLPAAAPGLVMIRAPIPACFSRVHQGVRGAGVGHRSLAVDAVEPEEAQYLDGPLRLRTAHRFPPPADRPARRDGAALAAEGRGPSHPAQDALVELFAEEGEQAPDLVFGAGDQVLVEGQVYVAPPELPQRDVVVDAPEKDVPLEIRPGAPDLPLKRPQEVFHELVLPHRLGEVVAPPQVEPGVGHGARVSEEQHDRHAGEVSVHPAQEEVSPYVLDQAPPGDEPTSAAIRPKTPESTGEYRPRRTEELFPPVVRPQVLLGPEILAQSYPARVEGLEDVTVLAPVVDHLGDPRRSAPSAAGEEDRVSMVPTEIQAKRAEQALPEIPRRPAGHARVPRRSPRGAPSVGYRGGSPSAGRSSASGESHAFSEASFAATAARTKKKRVEAGMYQCHSAKEEIR